MTGAHRAEAEPRTPDGIRKDVGELRTELGDTVEELAHRADVPARARARKDEAIRQVQRQLDRARAAAVEKAPAVTSAVRENRALVAVVAALLGAALAFRALRRRSRA